MPWVGLVLDAFELVDDNSFLWHVRAGTIQAAAGEVLTTDPFSMSLRGEPWITQSWLAELLYAWLEDGMGIGFASFVMLACAVLTITGLGIIAFRRSESVPATAVVVILSTILFLRFIVPRPFVFAYPLFVLVVLAWDRRETRWTLPFLFWIWASVHGSFAIGLVYLGLSVLARRDRRALRVVLASGAVTLLTAHGMGVVTMLLDFARSRRYLDLVTEWRTPDFLEIPLLPVMIGIVVMIYGAMRQRIRPADLWIIGPFLLLTASATRAVPTGWIALVPLVAASMRGLEVRGLRGYPTGAAAVVLTAMLVLPFAFLEPVTIDDEQLPVEASTTLLDVPTFHDDIAGGYLIWDETLSGGVFIDDRVEFYGGRIEEFFNVRTMREPWEPVFSSNGIEQALLRVSEPLVADLVEAGWVFTHQDDHFVVLVPG
ncbi:MAG: hypothetical protein R3258_08440 [Acidimicrobiia bacterium]|nr:hypothetical protein [Acidimicrobiia bacterium]